MVSALKVFKELSVIIRLRNENKVHFRTIMILYVSASLILLEDVYIKYHHIYFICHDTIIFQFFKGMHFFRIIYDMWVRAAWLVYKYNL